MLSGSSESLAAFKEASRYVTGGVFIYEGSSVTATVAAKDNLKQLRIERTAPKGKFFGFAVSQKLTFDIIGKYPLDKGTVVKPYINIVDTTAPEQPYFYVDKVEINETTNTTTVTAYDIVSRAAEKSISELSFAYPMDISAFAEQVIAAFGGILNGAFTTTNFAIQESPNFSGKETLAEVLAAIAEVTGTICFCSYDNNIKFRTLSTEYIIDTITTSDYFNLSTQEATELTKIVSATELGDNVSCGADGGATQILWDNPFIVLRTDAATLLEKIGSLVLGLKVNPHNLVWRGTACYEIGDYLNVNTVKGDVAGFYYFNDTLKFNGGLSSTVNWEPAENENPSSNPTSLGAALNQTFAKVDKVNKRIDLVVEETNENTIAIAKLGITTDEIKASVTSQNAQIGNIETEVESMQSKVEAAVTAEEVKLQIETTLNSAVDSITSKTGYTFGNEGLFIEKSDSEMKTQITEDGLSIYRNSDKILKVDNEGVKAEDLHATTYLMIGSHSRFEDYQSERTGCFWTVKLETEVE
jgi:hypothetical protein